LKFNIKFEGSSSGTGAKQLDIKLKGSNVDLIYIHRARMYPYQDYTITVKISEDNFKHTDNNRGIQRDEFLKLLTNVEVIAIKASLHDPQHNARLSKVSLEHAERPQRPTGRNVASSVEICECPVGYTGNSCENCAQGYVRTNPYGYFLGTCERDPYAGRLPQIQINVPADNIVNVRPGETHVVYVTVVGSNQNVVWVKEPEGNLPYGVSQDDNNLVLRNADPSMSGTYACYIRLPDGEVKKVIVINVPSTGDLNFYFIFLFFVLF
jgi:hypothetical protein